MGSPGDATCARRPVAALATAALMACAASGPAAEGQVRVGEAELSYRVIGAGPDTVIGWLPASWTDSLARGHTVLALSGGETESPETMADLLDRLRETFAVSRFALVAGGKQAAGAAAYAQRAPARVARLAAVNPSADARLPSAGAARVPILVIETGGAPMPASRQWALRFTESRLMTAPDSAVAIAAMVGFVAGRWPAGSRVLLP